MTTLKPGDVVTDEPTEVGTVVADAQGDRSELTATWVRFGDPVDWENILRYGPLTLVSTPTPALSPAPAGDAAAELEALARQLETDAAGDTHTTGVQAGITWGARCARERAAELRASAPAPAERWETITAAADVRVGDDIEVTKTWDGGEFRASGHVTHVDPTMVSFGRHSYALHPDGDLYVTVTIRRRVRQQMREPEAPAVVRHAGLIWARRIDSVQWFGLDNHDGGRLWREVLALDPATDPVVVDLGGGE